MKILPDDIMYIEAVQKVVGLLLLNGIKNFAVKKSSKSNSVYIDIKNNHVFLGETTVRISDHGFNHSVPGLFHINIYSDTIEDDLLTIMTNQELPVHYFANIKSD